MFENFINNYGKFVTKLSFHFSRAEIQLFCTICTIDISICISRSILNKIIDLVLISDI